MEGFAIRFKELREGLRMTLQQVADALNISKQAVHKLETGEMKPSGEVMLAICRLFGRDYEYFREAVDTAYTLDQIRFRHSGEKLVKHFALLNIRQDILKEVSYFIKLENLLEIDRSFENPISDLDIKSRTDVEKAAKQLRKKWKLGTAPIADVVDTLEGRGVYVIEILCADEEFSGLSTMLNDEIPVIVLNGSVSTLERKRLTAIHELGHLLLRFAEHLDEGAVEQYCNHFAGAVLLADEVFWDELGKKRLAISFIELKRLQETYGISIPAIIIRAGEIGFISNNDKNSWQEAYTAWGRKQLKDDGGGRFLGREKPSRKNNLLVRAIAEKRIMWSKAAELMHTTIDYLKSQFEAEVFAIQR